MASCKSIEKLALPFTHQHHVRGVGIGFGGPVDCKRGRAHQKPSHFRLE